MCIQLLSFLLISISSFGLIVQAQCQPGNPVGGSFIYPPACIIGESANTATYQENRILELGSVQNLSWTTNYPKTEYFNLTLWQQDLSANGAQVSQTPLYAHNEGDQILESITWVVQLYELNLDSSNVFYLEMGWSGPRFFSHYFNISRASTTSPSPTNSANSSTATQASAALSDNTSDSLLSGGAKIGMGVGVGLGVPILLLSGIIIGVRASRSYRTQTGSLRISTGDTNLVQKPTHNMQLLEDHSHRAELPENQARHELPSRSTPHEMRA